MEINRTNNPKSNACAAERQEFQHMDVMLITYLHTRYASFVGQHSWDCKRKHRAVRRQLGLPCWGQLPLWSAVRHRQHTIDLLMVRTITSLFVDITSFPTNILLGCLFWLFWMNFFLTIRHPSISNIFCYLICCLIYSITHYCYPLQLQLQQMGLFEINTNTFA